jgi:MFS family permease
MHYTEHDYNSLIIASAFGTLIATLPFNWVYTKYGARFVFFGAGIVSIVSSVLVPASAKLGFTWLYIVRFVQVSDCT